MVAAHLALILGSIIALMILRYQEERENPGAWVTVTVRIGDAPPLMLTDLWLTGRDLMKLRRCGRLPDDLTLVGQRNPAHPDWHPGTLRVKS